MSEQVSRACVLCSNITCQRLTLRRFVMTCSHYTSMRFYYHGLTLCGCSICVNTLLTSMKLYYDCLTLLFCYDMFTLLHRHEILLPWVNFSSVCYAVFTRSFTHSIRIYCCGLTLMHFVTPCLQCSCTYQHENSLPWVNSSSLFMPCLHS